MRVSGFTILRNAVTLGYPFVESIQSLLPLVDELVIGIGDGDDGTWEAVHSIADPRIECFRSKWDLSERRFGLTLGIQTNLALQRCTGDWAVYLQADEVLHEDDLEILQSSMQRNLTRRIEGLLFDYLHFFRSYDVVARDWSVWYPRAVRAIKLGHGIESAGDACGFRVHKEGYSRGLFKASSGARIFHYGWCGEQHHVIERKHNLRRFYHDDAWVEEHSPELDQDYLAGTKGTRFITFNGTHPSVMKNRVADGRGTISAIVKNQLGGKSGRRRSLFPYRFGGGAGDIRPLIPTALSNVGWLAIDYWKSFGARRRSSAIQD